MAIFTWPFTNMHELNLDWIIQRLDEFEARLDSAIGDAVKQANAYTDSKLESFRTEFDGLKKEIYDAMGDLKQQQNSFIAEVTTRIDNINAKVDTLENNINAGINAMQAYTDIEIAKNNEYILDQISSQLIGVQVINFFTGQKVTLQQMFDTLAQFHLQASMTYSKYAAKSVTYDHLAGLNITYTELVNNGDTLVK